MARRLPMSTATTIISRKCQRSEAGGSPSTDDRSWNTRLMQLRHCLVGDFEATVDDREGLAHLRLGDAQWRVGEERVPAHERVEPFLPEELAERRHLLRRAVERRERDRFRVVAHELDEAEET